MGVVDFEQLTALLKDGSIVLVDVRNDSELKEDGKIPGSQNIALPELSAAFQLAPEEFKQKYGFDQPSKENENLVLTCRSGKRAYQGRGQLEELGYQKIKVYEGSFLDWKAKGGNVQ